jgi:hypothetical protein
MDEMDEMVGNWEAELLERNGAFNGTQYDI